MTAKIEKTVFLRAAPEKVWDYLTQPEELKRWFHESRAPLEEGETYALKGGDGDDLCWGEVTSANPPKELIYTFTHNHLQGHKTRVHWTLEPVDSGTLLRLVHDGFEDAPVPAFDMLCAHDAGWDEHFGRMRELAREAA